MCPGFAEPDNPLACISADQCLNWKTCHQSGFKSCRLFIAGALQRMVYHHKISIIIIKSRSKLLIIRGWQHRGRSLLCYRMKRLNGSSSFWTSCVGEVSGGGEELGSLALQTLDQNGISTWHLLYT